MADLNTFKTIGVIGAGTMGSGIASISALNGFQTIVYDISSEILELSWSKIIAGFDELIKKGKLDLKKKADSESNLSFTLDFKLFSKCNLVIEAAAEDLEIKKEIFSKLNEIVSSDSVLATNTSSLSVTAISAAVKNNKSRVIGMHFFNPATIMKLVEIIRGEFTSDETLETTLEVTKKLGKTPVICKDTPGFIVNRIARPFYGESLKILGEGELSVEQIDNIMKNEGGFRMGPFELMDLIGIDVNLSVTKSVYEALNLNPKYEPHPIQEKMVASGNLGRKTGRGFYKYS